MTDKWNMSTEYRWNNSEKVKPTFLGKEIVPESHIHHKPHIECPDLPDERPGA